MNPQHALQPDFDQGIDRKILRIAHDRFAHVSQGRLARARNALGVRQQLVLDLLPLLFHVNHPLLPGYLSHQTPCRIQGYQPSPAALQAAQKLSRSFQYKDESRRPADILSLFLMGSTGTVAHSEGSDMDLWLCHRPDLGPDELRALQRKSDLICAWAAEQGQEMHVFLINDQVLRTGRLQARACGEDCGSAQHYLLLDEFYRTNILLAGSAPLWWLIPVHHESRYGHYGRLLTEKRFIRTEEYVDLGGVEHIPRDEFIGAGLWQLYKGIDAPHKSVLKMLLIETYAQQPDDPNLSLEFKQAIYQARLDLDELDPYIQLYRHLERYLMAQGEQERLELVRRCFYFKVGERLSLPASRPALAWRRALMERLVREWGWTGRDLRRLDGRCHWKIPQVQSERRILVKELTHCYRFLAHFARTRTDGARIRAEDVNLLGRKLHAALQRKAGKIEFINPAIAPNLAEDQLSFHHQSSQPGQDTEGWLLYRDLPSPADALIHPALKRAASLVELVAWAYLNGLLAPGTSISLVAGDSQASLQELLQIITSLRQALPLPLPPVPPENFRRNPRPLRCLLYINIGLDPQADLTRQGMHKLSSRTDPLGYGALRHNLVASLDLVSLNSWHEVLVTRFTQGNSLIQCLTSYLTALTMAPRPVSLPELQVHCFCPNRAAAIAGRVRELFEDVTRALFRNGSPQPTRYVLEIDQRFFVLQLNDTEPRFVSFDSLPSLLAHLQRPQKQYSPILLDRHALPGSPLASLCAQHRAGCIQVFYQLRGPEPAADNRPVAGSPPAELRRREQLADLYILDERGSLICHQTRCRDAHSLLVPIHRFLRSVQERRQMYHSLDDSPGHSGEILYYELVERPGQSPEVQARQPPRDGAFASFMEVQAICSGEWNGEPVFDIYCDHLEFTQLEHGDNLIARVAQYILARRAEGEQYPCYITDLGLSWNLVQGPGQAPPQTVQYLAHKFALERRLNQALAELI